MRSSLRAGFIVQCREEETIERVGRLLDRLKGLIEYFCGPAANEDDILNKEKLLKEISYVLVGLPLMTSTTIAHGELMSLLRHGLTVPCRPASKLVTITVSEELSFIQGTDTGDLHVIKGIISVDNPLANDLVMEVEPVVPLEAAEYIPWEWEEGAAVQKIPLQLGRYTLATYNRGEMPFELKRNGPTVTLVWKSWALNDSITVTRAQITLGLDQGITNLPRLTLDPPSLSHTATLHPSSSHILWRFTHLIPSTHYTLTLSQGQVKGARMEFGVEGGLVSGQRMEGMRVWQEGTGIGAGRQMEVRLEAAASPTYCTCIL